MRILRFLLKLCAVVAAALVGNWIGGQVRTYVTGQHVQSLRFRHTTPQGQTITNTPVATKFYPAIVASWLGKPRWLFAFCGGVLSAALIDDSYERRLWNRLGPAIAARSAAQERSAI